MKRFALVATAALVAATFVVPPADAAGIVKQVRGPAASVSCSGTVGGAIDANAVATFKIAKGVISASIKVKSGAPPNTAFFVNLTQVQAGDADCYSYTPGTRFFSKGPGKLTVKAKENIIPGATGTFIWVYTADGSSVRYASDGPVPLV